MGGIQELLLSIVTYLGVKRLPGACGVYGVCYDLPLTGRKRDMTAIRVFIFLNLLCRICVNYMPVFNKLRTSSSHVGFLIQGVGLVTPLSGNAFHRIFTFPF